MPIRLAIMKMHGLIHLIVYKPIDFESGSKISDRVEAIRGLMPLYRTCLQSVAN